MIFIKILFKTTCGFFTIHLLVKHWSVDELIIKQNIYGVVLNKIDD